ncbi:MAG: hypothetical protein HYW85_07375 [Deltaproteobacteria bacterium]|nr:hypothetical protein [Deltaproteobacteria bacterium]
MPAFCDFSLYWRESYFLVEGTGISTADLSNNSAADNGTGNDRVYSTMKLRMKPSLGITDRLSIHAMFDAFVTPHATLSQEEGAFQGMLPTDVNQYGPVLNGTSLPNALDGSGSGFGQSTATTGDGNFLIKTAFLEYISDWGILKIGRQPRHWGLGIRYNAGDKQQDKFGDRTDSIAYELGLGSIKLGLLYSKIAENTINSSKDDVNLYESYAHWNDPEKDLNLGFLYTFMRHSSNFVKLSFFDIYGTKKIKKFKAGLEAVATMGAPGTVSGNSAAQMGLASEFDYEWTEIINSYLKLGYASSPDVGKLTKLTVFAFDRNYDIAFLMFNQGLGAISAQTGISASSNPYTNTIFGAYYLNLGSNYQFNQRIGANLNYATALAPLPMVAGGNKNYGHEVDVTGWYAFLENLKVKVTTGFFLPGDFYKGTPTLNATTNPCYGGVASMLLTF